MLSASKRVLRRNLLVDHKKATCVSKLALTTSYNQFHHLLGKDFDFSSTLNKQLKSSNASSTSRICVSKCHARYSTNINNNTDNTKKTEDDTVAVNETPAFIATPPQKPSMIVNIAKGTMNLIIKLPIAIVNATVWTVKATANGTIAVVKNPKLLIEAPGKAWHVTKDVVGDLWARTKLLMADIAYTYRLFISKIAKGKELTRRERLQLEKTTADIFRLIPFAVIVLVPFMEFSLPILLKFFPDMLPSQFEDAMKKKERVKNTVKAQLELSKFLQDTLELMANDLKKSESVKTAATAAELSEFIKKIRNGEKVDEQYIKRFAKLFGDEITLDNLPRAQLVAMCRFLTLPQYGTDSMLRYRLRNKLRKLKADDKLIHWEGVNSLSMEELMLACQERGMKIGVPKKELRRQLQQWIELSLDTGIPSSLMILSRAMFFNQDKVEQSETSLKLALASLPNETIEEVGLSMETLESADANVYHKKLESLKRQEKLILEEESEQRKKLEEQKKKLQEQKMLFEQEKLAAQAADLAPPVQAEVETEAPPTPEQELAPAELEKVEDELKKLIAIMAYTSSMTTERVELDDLKDKHTMVVGMTKDVNENAALTRLREKVASMLQNVSVRIEEADREIGTGLNIIDRDKDGVLSIEEIEKSVEVLKHKPSQERLKELLLRLDHDGDGKIILKELIIELREALMKSRSEKKLEEAPAAEPVATPSPPTPSASSTTTSTPASSTPASQSTTAASSQQQTLIQPSESGKI